jgi:1-acyl-sn-glycerol-3-phosphate acyltransferase
MSQRPILWKSLQVVARVITTLMFDLKVYGRHHVPARGGVLIVSNHQGNLDPVLLAVRLARPLNYIAKSELFKNPFVGKFLRSLNAFPVRQGAGDVGAVKETIHRLRAGHLLNLYPEGARTPDGRIAPLQKGVGLIARRAGAGADVVIVPAVIVGSFEAWPIFRKWPRPHPICVEYGPPINLANLTPDQVLATIDATLRRMFSILQMRTHDIHPATARRYNRRTRSPVPAPAFPSGPASGSAKPPP